jgi:hypothetical protein
MTWSEIILLSLDSVVIGSAVAIFITSTRQELREWAMYVLPIVGTVLVAMTILVFLG